MFSYPRMMAVHAFLPLGIPVGIHPDADSNITPYPYYSGHNVPYPRYNSENTLDIRTAS